MRKSSRKSKFHFIHLGLLQSNLDSTGEIDAFKMLDAVHDKTGECSQEVLG